MSTKEELRAVARLDAAIMNLPCNLPADMAMFSPTSAYKLGHRDARHAAAELAAAALSRIEALERERDALKQQAQIWAQEAKTQKATVQAAYQACTGATGEPGDWNGAAPIRALAADRAALRNALEHIAGSCEGRAADVAKAALAVQEGIPS